MLMRDIVISRLAPIVASLFILTVLMRDIVISRSAPDGATLVILTIFLISTVRIKSPQLHGLS